MSLIIISKTTEHHFSIPYAEIIVNENLGFTIIIFGWSLLQDNLIYRRLVSNFITVVEWKNTVEVTA